MKTLPLSVVIIAYNEERIIERTLKAISSLASEIILVDSGSTDKTIETAKQYGAQCHYQQWLGYAAQKNFALSLASQEWILSLDADEIVSQDLAKEITNLLNARDSQLRDGYHIPRLLYIGDAPLKHGGFYPDAQLRLFKKGKGKFVERKVHESVQVEGSAGRLNSPLLHYSYTDFDHYASTLDRYAQLSAEEFYSRQNRKRDSKETDSNHNMSSWRTSKLNELIHPIWTFSYRYFVRGGFLDGRTGLKANAIYQDYVRKKITYLRDLYKAKKR